MSTYCLKSDTQTLAAVGTTTPVPFIPIFSTGVLPPSLLCFVSSGASLTYNVEVTGDDVQAFGYVAANGNWQPMSNMSGLTANTVNTLGAAVTAVRAHVTAWTSGTLTFSFVQVVVN